MKEKRILETVLLESERQDRNFVMLEFNIRKETVVMNYVYEGRGEPADVHTKRHDHDPELMDRGTFHALKDALYEHDIPFRERRDDFI